MAGDAMTICVDAAIDALKGANVTDGQYDAATKRCAKGAESNYEKSGGRGEDFGVDQKDAVADKVATRTQLCKGNLTECLAAAKKDFKRAGGAVST